MYNSRVCFGRLGRVGGSDIGALVRSCFPVNTHQKVVLDVGVSQVLSWAPPVFRNEWIRNIDSLPGTHLVALDWGVVRRQLEKGQVVRVW